MQCGALNNTCANIGQTPSHTELTNVSRIAHPSRVVHYETITASARNLDFNCGAKGGYTAGHLPGSPALALSLEKDAVNIHLRWSFPKESLTHCDVLFAHVDGRWEWGCSGPGAFQTLLQDAPPLRGTPTAMPSRGSAASSENASPPVPLSRRTVAASKRPVVFIRPRVGGWAT